MNTPADVSVINLHRVHSTSEDYTLSLVSTTPSSPSRESIEQEPTVITI